MKRKLHPLRRHGRRHVSALRRRECKLERGEVVITPNDRRDTFVRARDRGTGWRIRDIVAAGYPVASLVDMSRWEDVHAWLKANCTARGRRHYTWSGSAFWFETDADRRRFLAAFGDAVSPDYVQKFAF